MPPDLPRAGRRGLALARDYSRELVEPLLARHCPGVPFASARVGAGSEVLGLDDAMSRDHDWGLRLQLFVASHHVDVVRTTLERHLPATYDGHPVRFPTTERPEALLGVEVTTPAEFALAHLGCDPTRGATTAEWLAVSGQAALEVTAGEVFTDRVGELSRLREATAWYPDDVWRYVVACDWRRLDQELPLMARAGDRGDDLGSRLIAARLVEVAVHLAFLLSRVWPPYPKWRGTVFRGLPVAGRLESALGAALTADRWPERAEGLRLVLERLGEVQAALGLPTPRPVVVGFFDRPYPCIDPSLIAGLLASIGDETVRRLPVGLGGVDQRTDNVDVLVSPARRADAVR